MTPKLAIPTLRVQYVSLAENICVLVQEGLFVASAGSIEHIASTASICSRCTVGGQHDVSSDLSNKPAPLRSRTSVGGRDQRCGRSRIALSAHRLGASRRALGAG